MIEAPPIEWQLSVGGQIDADPHGDVNLGLRRGALSAALRTDALSLRWDPSAEHGRAWVELRGHAFAAAMLISPWTDGAPDPERALSLATAGGEAGALRYGRAGLYGGAKVSADRLFFGEMAATAIAVPDDRWLAAGDLLGGLYRPELSAWLRVGADLETGEAPRWSGHAAMEARWLPRWRAGAVALAPRVELWAGLGEGQDDLTRTRLGGLNPWVVPLAGAAWAERWVEDYAVLRLGPTVGLGEAGEGALGFRASPFVDLAAFDGAAEAGLGLGLRAWRGRAFLDLTPGFSPTIARAEGVGRTSVWFSLGLDWGAGHTPSGARPPGPPGVAWPG